MALQVAGWLPYGSDDPSVVFAHPLTRAIVADDITNKWSTVANTTAAPTHHATLGMKASDSGGGNAGYVLTTAAAAIQTLKDGGQLTLEVERDWVCRDDSAVGSIGYTPATEEVTLSFSPDGTNTSLSGVRKRTDKLISATIYNNQGTYLFDASDWVVNTAVNPSPSVHSDGKGQFVTLQLAWWGLTQGSPVIVGVDGLASGGNKLTGTLVNPVDRLYIGSARGVSGTFVKNYYMRNLQISNRPPVMPVHPKLRSIAFLSDSLTDNVVYNGPYKDCCAQLALRRAISQRGFRVGELFISENGGYTVSLTTQLDTEVATVLAWVPDVVIINGGTNDAGAAAYVGATFTTEYRDMIEKLFLGVSKNTRTSVQYVFCNIPPPYLAAATDTTKSVNHEDVRRRIEALPAWWNATYGATYGGGRVRTIDVYTALGGSHGLFADTALSIDGTHYAWKGNRLYGQAVARELLSYLT